MSFHIFRFIFLTSVGLDQISRALFTGCLQLGIISVPEISIAPLRLGNQTSTETTFPDPRIKLLKEHFD